MTLPRGARGGRSWHVGRGPKEARGPRGDLGKSTPRRGSRAKPEASEQHGLSPVMCQAVSEPIRKCSSNIVSGKKTVSPSPTGGLVPQLDCVRSCVESSLGGFGTERGWGL